MKIAIDITVARNAMLTANVVPYLRHFCVNETLNTYELVTAFEDRVK